jgi:RNA polymerase sigma-70 factor (sigma-E family)
VSTAAARAGPTESGAGHRSPDVAVSALYQQHAVGLIRLAVVLLGSRSAAEDVVQEAFFGLYRRWDRLASGDRALQYLRSSVLNGCRSVLRARTRDARRAARALPVEEQLPEQRVLLHEEHREVLAALRRLPARQREALVLRYFLDLPADQVAATMNVSEGTVKSTTSRALAALARRLGESS